LEALRLSLSMNNLIKRPGESTLKYSPFLFCEVVRCYLLDHTDRPRSYRWAEVSVLYGDDYLGLLVITR
jgi:hypothetical protein